MAARRPVGLPAHPVLAHVPAGLWAAAVVFEALVLLGTAGPWWALAWWNLVAGLVAALPAIATGFWELGRLGARHPALGAAAAHMMAAGTAAALFGVGVLLRGGPAAPEPALSGWSWCSTARARCAWRRPCGSERRWSTATAPAGGAVDAPPGPAYKTRRGPRSSAG